MPPDLLADLTDAQRAAVTYGDGPLLILAGAGSGKTRVITRRVAYLLAQGVKPWNILAITFTNKAAGEMKARVEKLVPGNRVWVSTFHSFGARLLRQYADRLGFDRNFTIYDTDDRNKLVKDTLNSAGLDDVKFSPERLAGAISKAKNQLLTPKEYEKSAVDFFSQTASKVYHGYEKRLRQAHAFDFDDLLYLPAMALRHNEELRANSIPASSMSSSTSIKTRTSRSTRSPTACRATTRTCASWGTLTNRFTDGEMPTSATSLTSSATSRPPRSSPWSETTAVPRRFCMRSMRSSITTNSARRSRS